MSKGVSMDDGFVTWVCEGVGFLWRHLHQRTTHRKKIPGRVVGIHWWQVACERMSAGEDVDEVMNDYGWERETRTTRRGP